MKLTPKQDAFVKAYLLNGGNATQAAISAGYSEKSANTQAAENMAKPSIIKAIQLHQLEVNKEFVWSKEKKLLMLQSAAVNGMELNSESKMNNPATAIAAIREHNLMQGDNAPIENNTRVSVCYTLAERLTGGSLR